MMYKTEGEARRALETIIRRNRLKLRVYRIEGEAISPGEEWLVRRVDSFGRIARGCDSRKAKRKLIGLARSLGLFPIPAWWEVRERIWESKRNRPLHDLYDGNIRQSNC